MPLAELDGNRIVVDTSYHERHLIKALPGSSWDSATRTWSAPLSWTTCVTLRGLFGDQLTVGPKLTEWSWRRYETAIKPAMELRELMTPADESRLQAIHPDLFPYQRVGVDFLATTRRALLADPMGLGKTAQAICACTEMMARGVEVGPILVICPNSVKYNWVKEFKRWCSDGETPVDAVVVEGGAARRRKLLAEPHEVYVMNWESVRLHTRLAGYGAIALSDAEKQPKELNAMGFKTVILDEVHRMKDPHAKQTRAVWAVCDQAENVFALTGTPIANNPSDLWSILRAIDPAGFPGKTKYVERWCETSFNFFGGMEIMGLNPATRDEFFKVLHPVMRRIPKEAALPQLPPKLPVQYRYTEMSAKQRKIYDQMEKQLVAQLESGDLLVAKNPLAKMGRLLQLAAATAEIDENDEVTLVNPSNKVDELVELLEEMGDDPLVVFAQSKKLINLAAARLEKLDVPHGLITGDQLPQERQVAADQFQAGKLRVILATIAAGGEGITLTRADTVCFLQRDWSSLKNAQAEDRVYRIGAEEHESVKVIEFVTPGTVEERKLEVLAEKAERFEEVVQDRETLARLLGAKR